MIAVRLAVRNLLRNRWRSGLTLAGIAVAVGLMVWTLAFYEGWIAEMVRGATSVETGQIQVQTADYAEDGRIYQSLAVDHALLDSIAGVAGVAGATARVSAHGIIGNEQRSRVARVVGVDPVREAEVSPVADAVIEGRWLSPDPEPFPAPREVVIGRDLARQLRVGPGDELVVFLEASDGSLGNDLLEVVGVTRTGNSELDRSAAFMALDDARLVTALEGRANSIVIRTDDPQTSRVVAEAVANGLARWVDVEVRSGAVTARTTSPDAGPTLPDPGPDSQAAETTSPTGGTTLGAGGDALVVRPWQELVPSMNQMIVLVRRSYWMLYVVIYLVAAMGILNTQRMSALERRREFGVMIAIGLRPRRMFRILQVETVTLGLCGTLVGLLLGGMLAWRHAVAGFDMTMLTDQASFTYMGVAFDERVHFVLSPLTMVQPALVMLLVAVVSGLWPAVTVARTEPAPTIAGRGA